MVVKPGASPLVSGLSFLCVNPVQLFKQKHSFFT
jgi:hypothetical protein